MHMQSRIIPDNVMTMHDQSGPCRIMADHDGLDTQCGRHVAAIGRTLPPRHAWGFILVESIRRRYIAEAEEPDIAEMIDIDQRIPPRAPVPIRSAHEVPPQPWPEYRPDIGMKKAELRVHTRKDEAGAHPGG